MRREGIQIFFPSFNFDSNRDMQNIEAEFFPTVLCLIDS